VSHADPAVIVDADLVSEVARSLVAAAAPGELPLFRATSDAYFRDPQGVLQPKPGKEEMLGFGVEAEVMLLTPAILEATRSVLRFLVAQLQSEAGSEASDAIRNRLERLLHRDPKTEPAEPGLSREQLAQVREIAFETGRKAQLPEQEATLLADAMIGRLALA
jgi:hypothetical protein